MAESGGDPSARGDLGRVGESAGGGDTWGPSIGLWQIRSLNSHRGTGRVRDEIANMNPVINARHANQLFAAGGWKQWTTFTSGKYNRYLGTGGVGLPLTDELGNDLVDAAGNAVDALTPNWAEALVRAAAQLGAVGKWFGNRENWLRVSKVAAGSGMLLVGTAMVVGKPILNILPAGKVGKVVKGVSAAGGKG